MRATLVTVAAIGEAALLLAAIRGGRRPTPIKPHLLISAAILPMELADNVEDGTTVVDTDRASPPDPLADCPQPAEQAIR